jgi:hypothetical protein
MEKNKKVDIPIKEKGKCCLCGEIYEHYGNNPAPIMFNGRCCDDCNENRVIPERLNRFKDAYIKRQKILVKHLNTSIPMEELL